ncbi:MAG: hypothetical protein WBF58_17900, partial [Xanthobacteraceae bacterium]
RAGAHARRRAVPACRPRRRFRLAIAGREDERTGVIDTGVIGTGGIGTGGTGRRHSLTAGNHGKQAAAP